MTVTIYRFSDTGAPALSGTSGDLITVLDACLVGSGGIAYGSTPSSGWTKSFSGTNAAVYRQGSGSNQFYFRVNDSGSALGADESGGSAGAKTARLRGYESMSALSTGSNPFPTTAQEAAGTIIRKSVSADTVTRPWIIFADQRTVYLYIITGDNATSWHGTMFGEFYSFKTSDNYRCAIIGRQTTQEGNGTANQEVMDVVTDVVGGTIAGHWITRDASGSVGAIAAGKHQNTSVMWINVQGAISAGNGGITFRNPPDHRVYIFPVILSHTVGGNTARGRLRGWWHFGHFSSVLSDGDTFTGTGSLAGKTFYIVKRTPNTLNSVGGVYCMEISNTWDSN